VALPRRGRAGERGARGEHFPADYICEAIDQTRGWFYSLHALATLLTHDGSEGLPRGPLADLAPNTGAFKNVIVLGHIVDENGEKMSKSKGNVVDPFAVLDAHGADALRWYLYASSPPEATKRFSQAHVEETLRDFFMTLWNTSTASSSSTPTSTGPTSPRRSRTSSEPPATAGSSRREA
jgi:isoleucyl-tRNA synthetase